MSLEATLLLLRLVSALLLIGFLAAIFILLWREFHRATRFESAPRRSYGRLIVLHQIDGRYLTTGESHPLQPLTSLGRSPTNTIRTEDTFASGEHALLALRHNQWWLEDRQSRNGTLLNDVPITQPVVITDGDIIGIGSLRFRLELELNHLDD